MNLRIATYSFTSRPDGERRYWVHIESWTLTAYLWSRIYHWYDMRFPPVQSKWFRRLLRWFPGDVDKGMRSWEHRRLRDRLAAWTINQDLRCYVLSGRGQHLMHTEITEEEAVAMGLRQEHLCD